MRDNKKEVHADPRINVPIQSDLTGAIQKPEVQAVQRLKEKTRACGDPLVPDFLACLAECN